jgi:hypothetical protein
VRRGNGCNDSGDNSEDFVTGPPSPRNTASMFNACATTQPSLASKLRPELANIFLSYDLSDVGVVRSKQGLLTYNSS